MGNYAICLNWDGDKQYWRFWLCPEQRDHQRLSIACSKEQNEDGTQYEGDRFNVVPDIVAGLLRVEEEAASNAQGGATTLLRSDFERIFQNTTLLQALEKDAANPFRTLVHIEPRGNYPRTSLPWMLVALFKALYLYLLRDERYRFMDADIVLTYCAWQRYNLLKILVSRYKGQPYVRLLDYEFAMAYRTLAEMLEQETFSYAFRVLWLYGRRAGSEGIGAEHLTASLVRERFRLSMALEQNGRPSETIDPDESPLDAPMCFRNTRKWKGVGVHKWFVRHGALVALRYLIRQWLLPRYDIYGAWQLARRIPQSWRSCVIPILAGIACLLAASSSFWPAIKNLALPTISQGISFGLQCLVPIILLAVGWRLDAASLPHLVLPRLYGGIAVGYLPFLFSQEVWWAITLFCSCSQDASSQATSLCSTNWWRLTPLLALSMFVAFFHLWHEAYAFTADRWVARCRTGTVFVWALVVGSWLGVWMVQLGQPILKSITDPQNPSRQALRFQPTLSGYLDNVPIPALLVFAPLALLMGIIVQILWEEKSVTASAWLPEER